jgi:hypothetical protein
MPRAEILNLRLMWLDAFGYLRSKTAMNFLNLNGGFWSPKVLEQDCIEIPNLDEVKLYNFIPATKTKQSVY